MINHKKPPENTGDAASESAAQEQLEWRDLQNAQIDSMAHVWDNQEDECWNDLDRNKGDKAKPSDKAAP